MKKSLQLSLAVLAVSVLTACGSGSSEDAADKYVGTWKSVCYSTTTGTGSTVYTKRIRTLSKASATELASSTILDNVFSDAGCVNIAGVWSTNSPGTGNYVLGAKAVFLGANADTYVHTNAAGATFSGYMALNGNQMFLVDSATGTATPAGWSIYAPYTKQ